MFDRKPKQISFGGLFLLGSALVFILVLLTVGTMAVLRDISPATRMQMAQEAIAASKLREAISLLDKVERLSAESELDTETKIKLHSLRADAQLRVGNIKFAQQDLQALLRLQKDPADQIRTKLKIVRRVHLVRSGQQVQEKKINAARNELLAAYNLIEGIPDDSQGTVRLKALETAGRTCQQAYQLVILEVQHEIRLLVARKVLLDVNKILLDLVFLPPTDPACPRLETKLTNLLASADLPASKHAWIEERISRARNWINRAFSFYGEALGPQQAFAAFQGITGLLVSANHPDTAAMICRIALDKHEGPFLGRAAERLASIYREAEQPELAIATLNEWAGKYPPAKLVKQTNSFPTPAQDAWISLMDFLVARKLVGPLSRGANILWPQYNRFGWRLQRLWPFYSGINNANAAEYTKDADQQLLSFVKNNYERPTAWLDRYQIAQRARIAGNLANNDPVKVTQVLQQWVGHRPWDVEGWLAQADFFSGQGKTYEALVALKQAYNLDNSEDTLKRIWKAREKSLTDQGKYIKLVAADLIKNGEVFSKHLSHPHQHLQLARHFLAQGLSREALFHAQSATHEYPNSKTVSLLLNRARFMAGRFEEARTSLETMWAKEPDDAPTIALLAQVYAALEIVDPKLNISLVQHGVTPAAYRLLISGLQDMQQWDEALVAAQHALTRFGQTDHWFNLAAGKACRKLTSQPDSRALAYFSTIPGDDEYYWVARRLRLETLAQIPGAAELKPAVNEFLDPQAPPEAVLASARFLIDIHSYTNARLLLEKLIRQPGSLSRGQLFATLARVRQLNGDPLGAIEAANQATAFPGGDQAFAFLVTAYLAQGNISEAAESWGLCPSIAKEQLSRLDQATVLALIGQNKEAQALYPAPPELDFPLSLARYRTLHSLCTTTKIGLPTTGDKDLDELVSAQPKQLAQCLFLLGQEGFALDAMRLTREIAPTPEDPGHPWQQFIIAKCRFAAGQIPEGIIASGLALAGNPVNAEARYLLARNVLDLGRNTHHQDRLFLYKDFLLPYWSISAGLNYGSMDFTEINNEFHHALFQALHDYVTEINQVVANPTIKYLRQELQRVERIFSARSTASPSSTLITKTLIQGDLGLACTYLEKAMEMTSGAEKAELGNSYFHLVHRYDRRQAKARTLAEAMLSDPEKPFGPALHFLIDTDPGSLEEAVKERQDTLVQQIEFGLSLPLASVDFQWAATSAQRLTLIDPPMALRLANQLLARCPSHLAAWCARALALDAMGRHGAAEKSLAFSNRYLPESNLLGTTILLQGRNNLPGLPSKAKALTLNNNLAAGQNRLALALWYLRTGDALQAFTLLAGAKEQTAEQLFFAAQAACFLNPPRQQMALETLLKLQSEYPDHRLTKHVDLILRMLKD